MAQAAPDLVSPDADGLVGEVKIWPSATLPGSKWRFADGAAISRTTYSLLFSRYGTSHGVGDGSTTFNLPDYEGKVLVGRDAGDSDFDAIGDTGGTKAATMPSHGHSLTGAPGGTFGSSGHTHSGTTGGNDIYQLADVGSTFGAASNGHTHGFTSGGPSATASPTVGTLAVDSAAGSGNNMPPYAVANYIVKVL